MWLHIYFPVVDVRGFIGVEDSLPKSNEEIYIIEMCGFAKFITKCESEYKRLQSGVRGRLASTSLIARKIKSSCTFNISEMFYVKCKRG
jgi:hypothetical protein